ncbi:hypothetical protein FXO37_23144 [Capsicum annuum]|nr:hypothetical protein FXO37_23144 [Capsicum annuum]
MVLANCSGVVQNEDEKMEGDMDGAGEGGGGGLIPYSERHFSRIDRSARSIFMLDYTLTGMSVLEPEHDEGRLEDKDAKLTNAADSEPLSDITSTDEEKHHEDKGKLEDKVAELPDSADSELGSGSKKQITSGRDSSSSRYIYVPPISLSQPFEEEVRVPLGVGAHDMDYVEAQENYGIEEENEVDAVNLDEDAENIGEKSAVGNANVRSESVNLPSLPPHASRARKTTSIA